MPATVATLKTYLGIAPATTVDEDAMAAAVAAANDAVTLDKPAWTVDPATGDPLASWRASADQAAHLLAARLYGRRGSSAGIAAFADVGISLLPRMDPDYRKLLQLGEYQDSVIA